MKQLNCHYCKTPLVKNKKRWDCPICKSSSSSLELKFLDAIEGLPLPEREVKFHVPADGEKKRQWRFDFAWPELKIAVEMEGGVFTEGRHTRGIGFSNDAEKYNVAVLQGWQILRYTASTLGSAKEQCSQLMTSKKSL